MNKINLIVLTREYPVSTAGTKRVQHLLEELPIEEVSIKVLSLRSQQKIENEVGIYNGIDYIRIGSGIKIYQILQIIKYYAYSVYLIYNFRKPKSKNIIYCYEGLDIENLLLILLSKLLRYKIIFDIVEDYDSFTANLKLISRFKFWTVRKLDRLNSILSDSIVVISTYLQRKYELIHAKRITLIPITAKLIYNNKLKTSFNQPFLIIYAGSFGDKDGVDIIIEGFIEFNKVVSDSKLYLIGSGEQQKRYAEKYKNTTNIVFTGFIPDKEYYLWLQRADVLCMCRTGSVFANAGFPFKLGEYLATGNPIITTKVSDVELYLTDQDAYLITPDDKQQFVNQLLLIRSNSEIAFKVGLNGIAICEKYFSPKINGQILYCLLKKI